MVDGSYVRGDFGQNNSDIDLTITFAGFSKIQVSQEKVKRFVSEQAAVISKRSPNRKPFSFDIQWQSLEQVIDTGRRGIEDWTEENIPSGYPKLWLYAFDQINNHRVLLGEDVTQFYTQIEPKSFVGLRLSRLEKAAETIKGERSKYELENGGISQIKNAFEVLRAIYLSKGFLSIDKFRICQYFEELTDFPEPRTTKRLINYIRTQEIDDIDEFRNELYNYTRIVIFRQKKGLTSSST